MAKYMFLSLNFALEINLCPNFEKGKYSPQVLFLGQTHPHADVALHAWHETSVHQLLEAVFILQPIVGCSFTTSLVKFSGRLNKFQFPFTDMNRCNSLPWCCFKYF
jgi:hypothetical protein